jgi:hypothetical protein
VRSTKCGTCGELTTQRSPVVTVRILQQHLDRFEHGNILRIFVLLRLKGGTSAERRVSDRLWWNATGALCGVSEEGRVASDSTVFVITLSETKEETVPVLRGSTERDDLP